MIKYNKMFIWNIIASIESVDVLQISFWTGRFYQNTCAKGSKPAVLIPVLTPNLCKLRARPGWPGRRQSQAKLLILNRPTPC